MRFLIKLALLVGLVALFLPGRPKDGAPGDPGLSPVVLLYGVQQAFTDLGGFCDRSPAACATARDAASFVGERIAEGAAIGYAMVRDKIAPHAGEPARAVEDPYPAPRSYSPPAPGRDGGNGGDIVTGALSPGNAAGGPAQTRAALSASPQVERPASARPAAGEPAGSTPATEFRPPQPYRQPISPGSTPDAKAAPAKPAPQSAKAHAKEATPAREPARTAAIVPPQLDHVPGSPKPFRMPAMAGGAREALHPMPLEIIPPERAPVPRFAPRA